MKVRVAAGVTPIVGDRWLPKLSSEPGAGREAWTAG
jgi:hypothetical protein